jgi:phage baseplate assembly protein W
MSTMVGFPWSIGGDGRTAQADDPTHVRDLIELVLFTSPGERVNRPTFGSGLLQAVFAPGGDAVAAAAQLLVQSSLQQWLADVIQVEAVAVTAVDSTVTVTVQYVIRSANDRRVDTFMRSV